MAASYIELLFDDAVLSSATAFFWARRQKIYLVTNWHNVSGIHPETGRHLNEVTAAEPNQIRCFLWEDSPKGQDYLASVEGTFSLYDERGPKWYEHPVHGRKVDVICLPVSGVEQIARPFNEHKFSPLITRVSSEVFIIGYPLGARSGYFPIWKRGSIASEPELDFDGLPKMLVDTLGAPGMSGSPVIRRTFGTAPLEGGTVAAVAQASKFLGVYSGRIHAGTQADLQLGVVWRASVIDEIIDGAIRGSK